MFSIGPDLVRIAILPAFIWIAVLDYRTRRVPSWVWWPLGLIGVVALGWAALDHVSTGGIALQIWTIQVAISVGMIGPLGYLFHRLGAFGAADAKAVIAIAVAYPTYPMIGIGEMTLPLVPSDLGVLAMTALVNGVLLGLMSPLGLAARNALHGRFSPRMFVGIPVRWDRIESHHGILLENRSGFTRNGLDLDALRMYLRWRDTELATLRSDPDGHVNPSSIPSTPTSPGDGRIRTDGGTATDDRWAARAFLEATDSPYGTRTEELRTALDLLCERDRIWVSPGIPFLVPLIGGLLIGITFGDVFTVLLGVVGI